MIRILLTLATLVSVGRAQTLWERVGADVIQSRVHISSDGRLYAVQDRALVSQSEGKSWVAIFPNPGCTAITIDSAQSLFVVSNSLLWISTNRGEDWLPRGAPLSSFWLESFGVGKLVSLGVEGVSISLDSGRTWSLKYEGEVGQLSIGAGNTFFVTKPAAILRSTDEGGTWSPVYTISWTINTLCTRATEVFAGITDGMTGSLLHSTNLGETWEGGDHSASNLNLYAVAVGLREHIFIAGAKLNPKATNEVTDAYLRRSTDKGFSWEPFQTGLPDTSVRSLLALPSGRLLAMTDGGVYRTLEPTAAVNASSQNALRFFPNPASETVRFAGELVARVDVRDNLGRVMPTEFDERLQILNVSHLVAGVYHGEVHTAIGRRQLRLLKR